MTETLSGPMLPPRNGLAPISVMVLLHGYGADGNDLIDIGRHLAPRFPGMLFVAPNAPYPCAQNPAGYEWFPLEIDRIAGRIAGVRAARPVLDRFLADLWAQTGMGAAQTVLCGFSQGAMMALHAGLSHPEPFRAIVAFSGALVPPDGPMNSTPVALIHGDLDGVVDPAYSRDAEAMLRTAGNPVVHHVSHGVGHGIAPDGLGAATAFLLRQTA